MFDHMDGVMQALAQKKTPWKEDLFLAVMYAHQKLSKYSAEVPWTMRILPISALILDPFRKLQSFRNWDTGMDHNPEAETFYTTQYDDVFLKCGENEYYAKHPRLPVIKSKRVPNNILFSPAMASKSGQSSYDPNDLSCDVEEYWIPEDVGETTPGRSDHVARLLTALRHNVHSPP